MKIGFGPVCLRGIDVAQEETKKFMVVAKTVMTDYEILYSKDMTMQFVITSFD